MKIVIDIPDFIYTEIRNITENMDIIGHNTKALYNAIYHGIPLPEHHGRLIDADYLRKDFKASKKISFAFAERMDISCIVDHAPTIIEGSDSE